MKRDMNNERSDDSGKLVGISYKGKVADYIDGKWIIKIDQF